MPVVLSGKPVRDAILESLKPRVAALKRPPGLAVVLVGHDPASEIYVRNKVKACGELGIYSEKHLPDESISTDELLALVRSLNARDEIDGILVQLPLPKQVDERAVLLAIDPEKDVDGFHPVNIGNLVVGRPAPRACTPAGIMKMLEHYAIPVAGKRAVVVGRSNIVGKPMAMMLLHANATVTMCHSKTAELVGECLRADVLVAAIGRPAFLTQEFIAPHAAVVDVGMNRPPGAPVVGDVDPRAFEHSAAYTPVPGGVGLM